MELKDFKIKHLLELEQEYLMEHAVQHMIVDLLLCIRGGTSLNSWHEDTTEDPDAYPDYDSDDLCVFFFTLKLKW